jgi:hypothetical protein
LTSHDDWIWMSIWRFIEHCHYSISGFRSLNDRSLSWHSFIFFNGLEVRIKTPIILNRTRNLAHRLSSWSSANLWVVLITELLAWSLNLLSILKSESLISWSCLNIGVFYLLFFMKVIIHWIIFYSWTVIWHYRILWDMFEIVFNNDLLEILHVFSLWHYFFVFITYSPFCSPSNPSRGSFFRASCWAL